MTLTIDLLANHPKLIQDVARCCNEEWPWYYQDGDLDTALRYHALTAQSGGIPCALVALDGGALAGTIALLEEDLDLRPHLRPWLGCLYVWPQYRNIGVASALMEAGLALAKQQGIDTLYAWTEVLNASLPTRGWISVERLQYQEKEVEIFSINPLSLKSP